MFLQIPWLLAVHAKRLKTWEEEIMCGIVGGTSNRNILPILVEGLKRLEYRGYDSAGVAYKANGKISLVKN